MDASLAQTLVFAKTPKGVAEINARSGALTMQARRVLIMIDGRRPLAELMAVVRTGEFDPIMEALEQQGMIEKVDVAAPARNFDDEDFADTISLLQENAAALKALPHVHPADVIPALAQARPATLSGAAAPAVDASDDAATIAARAVANASAPRPPEPETRRPATIAVPMPHDVAVGKARTGTINTVIRSAEPARPVAPPPTVRAPLVNDAAGIAVATPVRGVTAAATRAEPAAAAAPAPAPSAAPATSRSLEEEKRFVVSTLYSILGPYGEQSAAKLMECTTMDGLREQVKAAGKRVVTFRGEKAAQDFLQSVGYA